MRTLWIVLSLTLFSSMLFAQKIERRVPPLPYLEDLPPLIDRELFFGDPEIAGAQLSPNGTYISFLKPHLGVLNIWVKKTDEPFEAARPITADTTRPVTAYFWSQDERYILYAQDKGGNENYHIYAVDLQAPPDPSTGVSPARDLTPLENVRAMIIAVPENQPDIMLIGLNDRNPALHDVYRLNIRTGKRELVIPNNENIAGWVADYDGNIRLAVRLDAEGNTQILNVNVTDTSFTPIYTCSVEETCNPVAFHPDQRRIYLVTNHGEQVDLARLILFDPETRQETLVDQDPEGKVDFGGAVFSRATKKLLATYYVGDRVRIYPKDKTFARDLERLRAQLPDGELGLGSMTRDDNLWIVSVSRDVDPGSTYLYDRRTGKVTFLYRSRPDLPTEYLAFMKPVHYQSRDGWDIPAYLTIPRNVKPEKLAVVVMPHGGPWARDVWGYNAYAQFLANRGYAVFQPNFRGSTGYGKRFLNAGNKEWGTGIMQHDITDGVQYLIDQGIADPERICIFGGSYGGYATLAGLAFTPDLYACGISYVGPSNLITLLKSIPPYWGPIRKIFDVRVGDPNNPDDIERLKVQSPFFHATNIKAPLMVIQGANDPRVKKAESDQIVVALRDLGRDVEYLLAPDEGHGFRRKENRLAVSVAIERFFARHLGGRYQEDVPPEIARRLQELTVDIQSVKLPETSKETLSSEALPPLEPEMLQPTTFMYTTTLQTAMGQRFSLESTRKLLKASWNGKDVWRVISRSSGPMGSAVDTFDLDIQTLQPVRRVASQGMVRLSLTYADTSVSGELQMGPQQSTIHARLEQPVLGDQAAFDIALAAMPLKEAFQTLVPIFDPQQQAVRMMEVNVVGTEEITLPAGTFQTYRVAVTPTDGGAGAATLWVRRSAPHWVLRAEQSLPAQMGGGKAITELKEIR